MAYRFNGSVCWNVSTEPRTTPLYNWTISAWLRVDTATCLGARWCGILGHYELGAYATHLATFPLNDLRVVAPLRASSLVGDWVGRLNAMGAFEDFPVGARGPALGSWLHVAAVRASVDSVNSSRLEIWINGTLSGTYANTSVRWPFPAEPPVAASRPPWFHLGCAYSDAGVPRAGFTFEGLLDDVMVLDAALEAHEIAQLARLCSLGDVAVDGVCPPPQPPPPPPPSPRPPPPPNLTPAPPPDTSAATRASSSGTPLHWRWSVIGLMLLLTLASGAAIWAITARARKRVASASDAVPSGGAVELT